MSVPASRSSLVPECRLPGAAEIARKVASGELSARAVLAQTFERVDRLNGTLNALVAQRREAALLEAADIDRRVDAGEPVGPLAGIPFTAKDVIATFGLPTTCGSNAVRGRLTDPDASAIARLRRADAVLIGKTNSPEFAFSIDTVNRRYGRTFNPLGEFTAGGSSGGEAAALAAGFTGFGLGTDFGGSVRWPAQCVGAVGLRPGVGRVPGTGQLPGVGLSAQLPPNPLTLQGRLQVIGPLARSVDDVELVLTALCGPDGIDPAAVPMPLADSRMVDIATVEVRWGAELGAARIDEDVLAALAHAAAVLEPQVAGLNPGLPRALAEAVDLYAELRAREPLVEIRAITVGREDELTDSIKRLLSVTPLREQSSLAALWARRDLLRAELLDWLSGSRVLILPVAVMPPFDIATQGLPTGLSEADIVAPCRAVSLFGCPAISVPVGHGHGGRPLSVQVVGAPFREDVVLAVARALEGGRRLTMAGLG